MTPATTASSPRSTTGRSYARTTSDYVDLETLYGRRCLIIGGRQSAFEWAALLPEAQASAVHVSYRHDTPAFARSDWSWVGVELLAATLKDG